MRRLVIGIDCGVTGAYAVLTADGSLLELQDLPIIRDGRLGWIDAGAFTADLRDLNIEGAELHAMVERTHAMPRNGSQAAFSQGATLGSTLAALQVLGARIELVAPAVWKRSFGLKSDKCQSLDRARLFFPSADLDRKKDHNRAESLLIAHYALNRRSA